MSKSLKSETPLGARGVSGSSTMSVQNIISTKKVIWWHVAVAKPNIFGASFLVLANRTNAIRLH
jgi:hypothetical protein